MRWRTAILFLPLLAPGLAGAQSGPANPDLGAPAQTEPPPFQMLGFCASPVPPSCLREPSAYADAGVAAACQQNVQRYVRSVFLYRQCLNAEMERAVRQANMAIVRHKCLMAKRRNCP